MKITLTLFLLIWIVFKPINALSQGNPSAHIHGEGQMAIVFENGDLLIEMTTAAENMLGFEHQPNSDRQWRAVDALQKKLQQPRELIILKNECELKNSVVDLPFKRTKHQNKHKLGDDNAHLHTHHDQNGKGAEQDSHERDHSDIYFRYEWRCEKSAFPKLTFQYFTEYPSFERMIVQWIINGKQGMTQLNKGENTFNVVQ